eukprot:760002-Hanusia_phi.AAC.1
MVVPCGVRVQRVIGVMALVVKLLTIDVGLFPCLTFTRQVPPKVPPSFYIIFDYPTRSTNFLSDVLDQRGSQGYPHLEKFGHGYIVRGSCSSLGWGRGMRKFIIMRFEKYWQRTSFIVP